jgi:hypothetical protein
MFATFEGAVAMDALACGYARKGNIHHGRVGEGLTLTLDMAGGPDCRCQGGSKEKQCKEGWQCGGCVVESVRVRPLECRGTATLTLWPPLCSPHVRSA